MTIIEVVSKIMVNLDEVTSSVLTANAYEYIDKIYPLIDTIQTEIATIVKPIKKYELALSSNKRISLPTNCFEFLKLFDSNMIPVRFVVYDGKIVIIDTTLDDATYMMHYNKYPNTINSLTPDNTELEIDRDCQEALIYGVCAGLTINDEPELYNVYSERYNNLLANIQQRMESNSSATLVGGLRI